MKRSPLLEVPNKHGRCGTPLGGYPFRGRSFLKIKFKGTGLQVSPGTDMKEKELPGFLDSWVPVPSPPDKTRRCERKPSNWWFPLRGSLGSFPHSPVSTSKISFRAKSLRRTHGH